MSAGERQSAPIKTLYDARRAIEDVQTLRDVQPRRLFGILFPLWEIETTATQREGGPYELMERYIARGIDEGQLHTVEELAHFFGLQSETVKKILRFLSTIGHVTAMGNRWDLTPLGQESIRAGTKYIAMEKRVNFYFDGYTSSPLRKEHYNRKYVHILSPEEALEVHYRRNWGYRFELLFNMIPWRETALQELEVRIDKREYNVPPEMQCIQRLNVSPAYLPMYIIEAKRPSSTGSYYVVYTGIQDRHDTYFEHLINHNHSVRAALEGEKSFVPHDLWIDWLKERNISGIMPVERSDGFWQITLPGSMFEGASPRFALQRIGDYELNYGYFIQIWCDNKALRRKAALDHVLRIIKGRQEYVKRQNIRELLQSKAQQLQTDELEFSDLQSRAKETGMKDLAQILR